MASKRDRFDILEGILQRGIEGASKTNIVYKVNLNFTMATPYLDLLVSRGLMETLPGPIKKYKTTDKGMRLLSDLKKIHEGM